MQKPVGDLAPGAEITCPRCGARGKVGVDRFRAGGKEYVYLTVRHYEGSRVRRCVLAPYEGRGTNAKVPEKGTYAKVPEAKVPERPQAPEKGTIAEVEVVAERKVPEAKAETKVPSLDPVALDRVAWYATKLLLAYGTYRAQPSEESFRQLLNVLKQLRERLGVDVSAAEAAVAALHSKQSTDAVIAATTAVKELVKNIIARILAPGTQAPSQTPLPAPAQVPLPEVGNLAQGIREVVREEVVKAVETAIESIQAVRDQVQQVQREIEYVKEQVRQRKGVGARAVARGERRIEFKEGNLYWMIREVMKSGGEWTKERLAEEIRKRFKKEVSGNSVSGRLSELAAAGYVAFRRQGRAWLWRWTGA